jgi:hypothetical protein
MASPERPAEPEIDEETKRILDEWDSGFAQEKNAARPWPEVRTEILRQSKDLVRQRSSPSRLPERRTRFGIRQYAQISMPALYICTVCRSRYTSRSPCLKKIGSRRFSDFFAVHAAGKVRNLDASQPSHAGYVSAKSNKRIAFISCHPIPLQPRV